MTTDTPPLLPPPEQELVHEKSWLAKFTRITSSGNYIPEIDGLRFIAVMMVLVYHLEVWALGVVKRDQTLWTLSLAFGVELFFAISGFILALPFAAHYLRGTKKVRVKEYFVRRITRLEPPYMLFMTVMTIVKAATIENYFPAIFTNLALSLFYVHNALVGEHSPVSAVVWSLEIEVQFYILMPLLASVFLIKNRWLRRALIVLPCAILIPRQPIFHATWMFLHPEAQEYNDGHLLNFYQYFAAGILLADVWVTEWSNKPPAFKRRFSIADVVWLLTWPAGLFAALHRGAIQNAGMPIVIFIHLLSMFQSAWARRLMRVPVIAVIGGMCYSIYLIHNPIFSVAFNALPRLGIFPRTYWGSLLVGFLTILPAALVVSAAYFRWIERPCMRRDWWAGVKAAFGKLLFVQDDASDR